MMLSTEPTSVAGASTASASDTPNEPAIAFAMPGGVVGDVHEAEQRLDLEIVEPGARGFAQPRELLVGRLGEQRLRGLARLAFARAQVRVDPDDLRLARGEPEDLLPAPADQERQVARPAAASACRRDR